jgi:hypothetical protein
MDKLKILESAEHTTEVTPEKRYGTTRADVNYNVTKRRNDPMEMPFSPPIKTSGTARTPELSRPSLPDP